MKKLTSINVEKRTLLDFNKKRLNVSIKQNNGKIISQDEFVKQLLAKIKGRSKK